MAKLSFDDIGIAAIAAAVPKHTVKNYDYTSFFDSETAKSITDKTGIYERRFAPDGLCSSDLALAAAERLIYDNNINRSEIGAIIFVSQTADYKMPATSVILQNKLKLPASTMAFDINLGCSGYVYGLSVAFSMIKAGIQKYVLLLNGEVRSRVYSPKDRQVAFLFGDAGSASLISNNSNFGQSNFLLCNDGSLEDYIKIKSGGARNPSSPLSMIEKIIDGEGNIRSEEHGYIKGHEVFSFVLNNIPMHILELFRHANTSADDISHAFLHQANGFLNKQILRKINLNVDFAPSSLEFFGNTSSVSIPLTMSFQKDNFNHSASKVLLSGFGVGMSWASCILDISHTNISELVQI